MKDLIPNSGLRQAVADNVDALAKRHQHWLKKEDMKKPLNIDDTTELIRLDSPSNRIVYPVEIVGNLLYPSSCVHNLGVLDCHLETN